MTARYLIRLDDACHTMDRRKWQMVEDLLDGSGVKPIVAVVPDNRDPDLFADTFEPMFWDRVRAWRQKGWTIAMHGNTHVMHATKDKLVLPFYERSEFGGLPYHRQAEKIRQSWTHFVSEEVRPTVWIAPAHCFDWVTLRAIHDETPIRIISDGIACDAYFEKDFFWIPQQLWEFKEKGAGLWTVCLHPNSMTEQSISRLGKMIETLFLPRIISLTDVDLTGRPKSLTDRVYYHYFWKRRLANDMMLKARAWLRG